LLEQLTEPREALCQLIIENITKHAEEEMHRARSRREVQSFHALCGYTTLQEPSGV
jgi:hypothetical protein